jgi:hypothetical protein
MRWIILIFLILLGISGGGWMLFDGLRRFVVGDYVRINGQIGPWQHIFVMLGINPLGTPVTGLFIFCGVARLAATAGLAAQTHWGWAVSVLSAIASIWFLPLGTVNSIVTLILLYMPAMRV